MSSSSSPADPPAGGAPDVDRALLSALARDGRASFTELAERVGLSVSAVHQRVRRLEQRGLITGYAAHLDAKALGLPLEPGMAFSIEPGIYLAGRCGARIEDIVVCTDDGVRSLNGGPRELVELPG